MRRWIVLACAGVMVSLASCETAGPKNFDEAMIVVEKAREVAQEQGVAWHADLTFDGSPNFYESAAVGLNTGITVRVHFQGNAARAEEPGAAGG
ncbi:MAG: hypothetical protein JSU86_08520 [Phycisphaerales bacterium]|nr:MAG: hypothetical protein JSU86_08520 [Phycisphaerales bacterium]